MHLEASSQIQCDIVKNLGTHMSNSFDETCEVFISCYLNIGAEVHFSFVDVARSRGLEVK